MSSPILVDIDSLITPIADENKAGEDIRLDPSPTSLYNQIKDARKAARDAERNSLFDGGSSEASENWRKVLDLAPEILSQKTKDLEIASWYTEALIRKAGFQGLRDGFLLINELIGEFWDDIYPLPDEDGIETRVAPLTGLNGEGAEGVLIAPIRNVELTEDIEPGPFNSWQYKQALDIQKIVDEETRAEKAAKIGFTLEDIENVVSGSSDDFYTNINNDIKMSIDVYRSISQKLTEHCGTHEAPPTSNIIHTLEETLGIVNHIGRFKIPTQDDTNDEIDSESPQSVADSNTTTVSHGPVKNRTDAFKQLHNISEFFRKTEPHSPISYVLDKAVRWGDMDLGDLMKELIPDNSSRETYSSLTGVRTDDDI